MSDGSVTIDARLALDELKKDLKNLKSVMKSSLPSATTCLDALSKGFGNVGKMATKAGEACSIATAAVSAFAGYAVKVGSSFEAGMSKVEAISGATKDEIAQLTEKAKEMGAKTKFSATESADAFQYMAMAGWKTGDMLDGIEGLMNLAAASGEDLASVSDIVTDALTAFGLKASDSAHFADVLAKASSNSNTNVGMMGETFKYVAPLAGSMGYSIEDTATAIGLMANAGIKSTQAGTALRSMLTRLVKPPKDAATALDSLGISATNSDGTMKPLSQTLQELRTKFAGLDDSQKATYASSIAGQEAMSGLLAIVNASDADYEKLSTAISNADGTAKQMADTMNNNLSGAFTIMKSNIEASGISAFDKIKDTLTDLVTSATELIPKLEPIIDGVFSQIKPALEDFTDLIKNISDAISNMSDEKLKAIGETIFKVASAGPKLLILGKAFGVAKTAVGGFKTAIDTVSKAHEGINKISEAFKSLKTAGTFTNIATNSLNLLKTGLSSAGSIATKFGSLVKVAFSAVCSPVGIAVVAIGALVAIFVVLWNKCDWFREFWINLWESIKSGLVTAKDFICEKIEAIGEFFSKLPEKFNEVKQKVAEFANNVISKIKEMPGKIVTALSNLKSKVQETFTNAVEGLKSIAESIVNRVVSFFLELPYKIGYALGLIIGFFVNIGVQIGNWIQENVPLIIESIVTFFSELPGKIWTFLSEIITKIIEWGTIFFTNAILWVSNTITNIITFFSELPGKIWTFLLNVINFVITWGTTIFNTAVEWVSNLINNVVTFFSELPGKIWEFLLNVINNIVAWGKSAWEKAKLYTSNLITSVVTFFSELPGKIWTFLLNVISNVVSWGRDMVAKGKQAASDLVTSILKKIGELPGKVMETGRNIVEGLWNGIVGAKDWIVGKVGEFASGILDGMKAALGIHSPSREFRDEVGKYIALGVGEGFTDNIAKVYKKMKASVDFETQKISSNISATTELKTARGSSDTITNNNDNGIAVTQNFYEKVQSPYETAKATRSTLRSLAYAK